MRSLDRSKDNSQTDRIAKPVEINDLRAVL